MEHLLKNDVKKWSYFDDMAPKSGVPIWKRGFRGLIDDVVLLANGGGDVGRPNGFWMLLSLFLGILR